MNSKIFSLVFSTFLLFLVVIGFSSRLFFIPPLGSLLNPFSGIVQSGKPDFIDNKIKVFKVAIQDEVNIYYDNRLVPHIYAKNTNDLFFTQGYVSAFLRLWQMDVSSRFSAGKMSEIFSGSNYLEFDRKRRREGILQSAQESLHLIEKDAETIQALTSYTNGVNAYINNLSYADLPLEYKIYDIPVEPWSNLKSVLILKGLSSTLTDYEEDLVMSKMILSLGDKNFNRLYPESVGNLTPIIGDATSEKNMQIQVKKPDYLDYSFFEKKSQIHPRSYNPNLGSNAWAISGEKSESGNVILAADPHLELTLPNIWLEMQIQCPDLSAYGVGIPGIPSILIGFNSDIAWGLTNGAEDVKDWYKMQISPDYKSYKSGDKWLSLNKRIDSIKRRDSFIFIDTVYYSQFGPIVYDNNFGKGDSHKDFSLKWELNNPSNDLKTFININKAKCSNDFIKAIKEHSIPVFNFVYATKEDTIGVFHQGKILNRHVGVGKFVFDGSKESANLYNYIPMDSLPHSINPISNYVVSANQRPTLLSYEYYFSGNFQETRAQKITQLLTKKSKMNINDMKNIQLDNTNVIAEEYLKPILKMINTQSLNSNQLKIYSRLSTWDYQHNLQDSVGYLYEQFLNYLTDITWDELQQYDFVRRAPNSRVLLEMIIKDPENIYFDRLGSNRIENSYDVVNEAFGVLLDNINTGMINQNMLWGSYNSVNFRSLGNMSELGMNNVATPGSPSSINATSNKWGPSWRMIVELGEKPKAIGIYPGGQSGNLASKYYQNSIIPWRDGTYFELNFYDNEKKIPKKKHMVWNFRKN
ncbi:penicillin acylase family protein [Sphingobacterium sp. ML3W]|uniref:penicillin acylase family protein n=1 Tax=Sphingobacterium sp. ML3W TaxID=1538644 RepID=UPI00249BCAA9|nr:penicillin acylase family protein [Sphingobacterium sp. ML3W]WFA78757.1 penicillin acylase family protein [Sphingobacterium sp. ML3W]